MALPAGNIDCRAADCKWTVNADKHDLLEHIGSGRTGVADSDTGFDCADASSSDNATASKSLITPCWKGANGERGLPETQGGRMVVWSLLLDNTRCNGFNKF